MSGAALVLPATPKMLYCDPTNLHCYTTTFQELVKYLSPKSPSPGTMYFCSLSDSSTQAVMTLTFGYASNMA
jgi:hypothetical protein